MKSNLWLSILKALKFPLKLLARLVRKKSKKVRSEREKKQRTHVWNFDPTRLNNRTWQKSSGKYKKKRNVKNKKPKQNSPITN